MSENFINLDVKWINVFQNGDMYTPPIKFVVYRKHLRNFDVFLNSLTQRLKPRFGAIRNLYTPIHGCKISSLDDLEPNQNYVAAGTEKFRKVRYGSIHVLAHPTRSSQYRPYSLVEIQPVVHSALKVASRYKTAIKNSAALTIFVYRNGDDISPPKVVPLVKKDLRNWDVVLKRVSDKIMPFSSCHLRRLCNLNGSIINRMTELNNGEYYVAVIGSENFKSVSYGMLNPPVSRKFTNWSLSDFASPYRRLNNSINLSSISNRFGFGENKRQFFRNNSGRTRSTVLNDREKRHLSPVKSGQTFSTSNAKIREVDNDEDNSGVYRAKTRKDSQAQIITENENTVIDLPLDDLDAEEIKDEEIIPLTRKPARELHPNVYDENCVMDASHPAIQVFVDENDHGANNKNRLCGSPKEQRDVWCNEMRKLKDKILSKIHSASVEESSVSTKLDLDSEAIPSSSETTSRQHALLCETHRMPKNNQQKQWVEVPEKAKTKSKLRKPRIFTNKSTSSCASDATTYTVDSSSSSDNARNKSSTEETTDSSKLAVVRNNRQTHKLNSLTQRTSPIDSSPQSSTQSNDPFFGESTPNDSFANDSSYRDLFGKTYIIEKDSLENILNAQNSTEKFEGNRNMFVEMPSNFNAFKPSIPVQCGKDKLIDKQNVNSCKNSYLINGINNFGFQPECYTIDVEDGRQLILFQEEIDLDNLK